MYYIYVLLCQGGSFYTGITKDLCRRMRQHCGLQKGGAKYTKSHPPQALCCAWTASDRSTAQRFEIRFKQLERTQKERLVKNPERWIEFFPLLAALTIAPATVDSLSVYLGSKSHAT